MPTFLITGATGKQGGATLKALHNANRSDVKTYAMTRNPGSAAVEAFPSSVKATRGDLTDANSLRFVMKDIDAVHLVTDFTGPKGCDGEIEQGKIFVDVAKEMGLKHIVYSSVAGADEAKEVPHFQSKKVIEDYIIASSIPYTFLRPTSFMENMPTKPGFGRFMYFGVMKAIFGNDGVYHIAAEDIGKAAAQALFKPEQNRNRIINLVGEIANPDEMKAKVDKAEGFVSWRAWLPRSLILALMPKEFNHMFVWLSKTYANKRMPGSVEELKSLVPSVVDIETWTKQQKLAREVQTTKKDM